MSRLHVDSVVKSYGNRPILTDIFISCGTGEVVGLLGRNGCGKSTLLKIIFGSLKGEHRFVKVDQRWIKGLASGYRYIKYLPQDGFLPGKLKVRRAIELFCDKENAKIISEHYLIRKLIDSRCGNLAGGERRLLEVLLMIYCDAEFALIDEPYNGMSPIYIDEIKRLIREQSTNKGFIITDHNYRNVLDIATSTFLIHDGAMRTIKGTDDLKKWGYIL